jgi:hypothetical protein
LGGRILFGGFKMKEISFYPPFARNFPELQRKSSRPYHAGMFTISGAMMVWLKGNKAGQKLATRLAV